MRTVLAAAAAGALIMGSAAGAMAIPAKGKPAPAPYVKIQSIDLHRHSPINVDSVNTARDLKFSVVVRDKDASVEVMGVDVRLAQFDKKSSKTPTAPGLTLSSASDSKKVRKNSTTFKGVFTKAQLVGLNVPDGAKARLCISAVTPSFTDDTDKVATNLTMSAQTVRRLGEGTKKPVRECVTLYNPKAKPVKKNP